MTEQQQQPYPEASAQADFPAIEQEVLGLRKAGPERKAQEIAD